MALCNVTGTLYLPNGQLGKSLTLRFRRTDQSVKAEYLGAVVPHDVYTQSDKSGQVDFDILTGVYVMHVEGGYSVQAIVPDAATADITDCIDAAAIPDQPPVWYQQALDARDEAVDAAEDAQAAADEIEGLIEDIATAQETADEAKAAAESASDDAAAADAKASSAQAAAGVTPADYGVLGNGTDETAAIHAMLDDTTQSGATVNWGSGEYRFSRYQCPHAAPRVSWRGKGAARCSIYALNRDRNFALLDGLIWTGRAGDKAPVPNATNVDVLSTELTGTTGADGHLSVSLTPGTHSALFIENRFGSAQLIQIDCNLLL